MLTLAWLRCMEFFIEKTIKCKPLFLSFLCGRCTVLQTRFPPFVKETDKSGGKEGKKERNLQIPSFSSSSAATLFPFPW